MFKEEKIPELAFYFTNTMLNMALQEWSDKQQIEQFLQAFDLNTLDEKIQFLTGLTVVIRRYPDNLFPKPEVRTNLLQVIQEVLDECILQEN